MYFLAGNLFLQLVYLAHNIKQILLSEEEETAKQRGTAQWHVIKK
jgi:hypothetical protein